MVPIIATIKPADTGPQVANLQDALLALLERKIIRSLDAPNRATQEELNELSKGLKQERAQSLFGEATRQLVTYFHVQQGIGDNLRGVVEDKTAAKLNELLKSIGAFDNPDSASFVVCGQVRFADGTLVRAYDKDLRSKELLGKPKPVITNTEGRYELTYTAGQFSQVEKGNADLLVEATTAAAGAYRITYNEDQFRRSPGEQGGLACAYKA